MQKAQWLGSVPALIYTLFVGALSDDLGRKPLIIIPLIGGILSAVSDVFMYIYLETLPLEFFYLEQFYYFLGGSPVYYLGFYGYGSSITSFKERASRLARFDGTETLAILCGTALSPIITSSIGNLGALIARCALALCAVVYLFFVKEPIKKKENMGSGNSKTLCEKMRIFLIDGIVQPIYQMLKTVFKSRPKHLRTLLMIQLFVYGMYWFILNYYGLAYLYMLKILDNFDGEDYAYYMVASNLLSMFGLLVVMPIISGKLHIHEGLILTFITGTTTIGITLQGFAKKLWHFYVCEVFCMMRYSQYSTARALFTKSVGVDEVGKIFSAVAVLAAVMPIISNPVFRGLYNATIETFPAAFIFLAASIVGLCTLLNFLIFTQRHRLLVNRKGKVIQTVSDSVDHGLKEDTSCNKTSM